MAVTIRTGDMQLPDVLTALGHPVRLQIVRVLADDDEHRCGGIVDGISKSTLTHHWKVLRDAGVINQRPSGRENLLSLRRDDLDERFPGLLDSILATQE
ncbi:ArsR/SmtB family transcription factor [Amycolatopsis albispora]|uniref:Transcriptional regulator n=1 Tax=Amycolatopsis albispora TaxID=1804986 RepID=A0A344LJI8_9PSEU|nr:helix-turn-helix domain-containing protein [Amycolatopsis albispora]AXB48212.1 transcriptional regulator [Amycolatopsis albispora]